jgi:hypothetical protein
MGFYDCSFIADTVAVKTHLIMLCNDRADLTVVECDRPPLEFRFRFVSCAPFYLLSCTQT